MSRTEQRDDGFGAYTEIIEDEELARLVEAGTPVKYRVVEDSWDEAFLVRTIKRVTDLEADETMTA